MIILLLLCLLSMKYLCSFIFVCLLIDCGLFGFVGLLKIIAVYFSLFFSLFLLCTTLKLDILLSGIRSGGSYFFLIFNFAAFWNKFIIIVLFFLVLWVFHGKHGDWMLVRLSFFLRIINLFFLFIFINIGFFYLDYPYFSFIHLTWYYSSHFQCFSFISQFFSFWALPLSSLIRKRGLLFRKKALYKIFFFEILIKLVVSLKMQLFLYILPFLVYIVIFIFTQYNFS